MIAHLAKLRGLLPEACSESLNCALGTAPSIAGSDRQFVAAASEDCAASYRTLVPLDFDHEEATVSILMAFHSGATNTSRIEEKNGARRSLGKLRVTTHRFLTKETRAHVIEEEDSQPQSRTERTKNLILAAVRVWELKRGIRG